MTLLGVECEPGLQVVAPSELFQHCQVVLGVVTSDVTNLQVA